MKVTPQEIIHDLITRPGLGMFAWLCIVFFAVGVMVFIWALKSGQLNDLEQSKFDMLDDRAESSEVRAEKGAKRNG